MAALHRPYASFTVPDIAQMGTTVYLAGHVYDMPPGWEEMFLDHADSKENRSITGSMAFFCSQRDRVAQCLNRRKMLFWRQFYLRHASAAMFWIPFPHIDRGTACDRERYFDGDVVVEIRQCLYARSLGYEKPLIVGMDPALANKIASYEADTVPPEYRGIRDCLDLLAEELHTIWQSPRDMIRCLAVEFSCPD